MPLWLGQHQQASPGPLQSPVAPGLPASPQSGPYTGQSPEAPMCHPPARFPSVLSGHIMPCSSPMGFTPSFCACKALVVETKKVKLPAGPVIPGVGDFLGADQPAQSAQLSQWACLLSLA